MTSTPLNPAMSLVAALFSLCNVAMRVEQLYVKGDVGGYTACLVLYMCFSASWHRLSACQESSVSADAGFARDRCHCSFFKLHCS